MEDKIKKSGGRSKADYYRLNAARCLVCDMVLTATKADELHQCDCGNLIVAGDCSSFGLKRYIKDLYLWDRYEELSQYGTGHRVSPGHVIKYPASALEPIRHGDWFVQHAYDRYSQSRGWILLDEFGQELEVNDIEVRKDKHHYSKLNFRFRPVFGYRISHLSDAIRNVPLHRYWLDVVVEPFLQTERTQGALVRLLVKAGFQDRTGMDRERREW